MMAYLRGIEHRCIECGKRAIVELVNAYNAPHGRYCQRCGNRRLADLKRAEDAAWANARASESQPN